MNFDGVPPRRSGLIPALRASGLRAEASGTPSTPPERPVVRSVALGEDSEGQKAGIMPFPSADRSRLEGWAALLERTGDYRVLRRLGDLPSFDEAKADAYVRRALFVDTETTGLDPTTDEIVELAMVTFAYTLDGRFLGVCNSFAAFRDPGRPIPAAVTALTGISDDMVAGRRIDPSDVAKRLSSVALVIAHNSDFDRRFCERLFPSFAEKPWACSLKEIAWSTEGFVNGTKLANLAGSFGYFFDGHRALDDCRAGITVLGATLPLSGRTVMAALLESARKPLWRIRALDAPYSHRSLLKSRGYRWHDGSDGRARAWFIDVPGGAPPLGTVVPGQAGLRAPRCFARRTPDCVRTIFRKSLMPSGSRNSKDRKRGHRSASAGRSSCREPRGIPDEGPEGDASGATTDPFLDARIWGAPVLGPNTAISAPFGWIGVTREFGRLCAKRLPGASARIRAFSMSPSGIAIEVEEADPNELRTLHLLAHEAGQAATRFEPDTGLLRPPFLRDLIRDVGHQNPNEARDVQLYLICFPAELARDRLIGDLQTIISNSRIPPEHQGPRLQDWTLAFPRGFTAVQLIGTVRLGDGSRTIREPLLAIDNLQRYARTTTTLFSLRDDTVPDQEGFLRP